MSSRRVHLGGEALTPPSNYDHPPISSILIILPFLLVRCLLV